MRRALLTTLFLALLILSACIAPIAQPPAAPASMGNGTSAETGADVIQVVDSTGRAFTIQRPVNRVVSLNRQISEALTLIGAHERVVGTGDTTIENNPFLPFTDLPDVGATGEVNLELLLSLQPEIVFAYTNRDVQILEEKLEPAGIQVIRVDYYRPDRQKDELRLIAKIMGVEENAERFIAWQESLETLREERLAGLTDEDRRTVIALSVGFLNSQGGYRVFPSRSADGSMGPGEGYATILAGGIDAAADIVWPPEQSGTTVLVEPEYVLQRNPEVVTLHGTWLGGYKAEDDSQFREVMTNILNTTSLPQIQAVNTGDVYIFHTDFLGAARNFIGVLQLAKDLYPDRFADIDVDAHHRRYFEEWLKAPFAGVWHFSLKDMQ
ncbi:MAG: ABC transporter substrate-binding protein [Caldilinea sp.]|nr:ABC transporter substrate-binding protein [Caldilinea sp.]MDW8440502.1 ABC transporter substrate-binding protein [Caldilineaceae bacterium]